MKNQIVKKLTDGLDTHERQDGKVTRVRAEGHPVAEVVVGSETVRVNFRERPASAEGLHLGGRSKSWPGGGVQVTDENADKVRALLEEAVEVALADDSPLTRGRHDENEVVTIPVRRRGRKMSEAKATEFMDELEQAEEEGILEDALSSDIAQLLSQRLTVARERRQAREAVTA